MPRSLRNKSSKHSKEYSDSERDSSLKERKGKEERDSGNVKVSKESGSSEKRKLVDSSQEKENNKDLCRGYQEESSLKRRKERGHNGGTRATYSDVEKKTLSSSRVDTEPDKVRSQSRPARVDGDVNTSSRRSSPDTISHVAGEDYSCFHEHLGYMLSENEVANLPNKTCKYKLDISAFGMPNYKWFGNDNCFIEDADINSSYGLKQKLYKHWFDVYKTSGVKDFHSSIQRYFFSLCNSYRDILHSNKKPFYLKGLKEDSSIMDAYVMHCLNHIFRTRDLIMKNDSKVSKHQESNKDEVLPDDGLLDHGFTRPKVLLLLPFISIAHRVVKRIIQLTPQAYKVNVEHVNRFHEEFGSPDDEDQNNSTENDKDSNPQNSSKPSDHESLFSGNCDDHFMIGIKFTRKTIKLFSDFYSSDMIVASPLKLREVHYLRIYTFNNLCTNFRQLIDSLSSLSEYAAAGNKEKDVDYLSSIEVLIIDYADVITMQNWSFVTSILEQLNQLPSKQHGTDIMLIRKWYLDGYAKFYRQTIITSDYVTPDKVGMRAQRCSLKVLGGVRQIYERFDATSVADADDARFDYFIQKVFPKINDSDQGGVMLFINSYFEYVRLRNYFKSQNASFCLLGDYAEQSDISPARLWFYEGKRNIMLYTQRLHFYRRYKIRGVRNLIIYSLPDRKEFYPEIVNTLEGNNDMACTVLFSRFDQLQLERIVGVTPARRMVKSDKGLFVFC